MTYRHRPNIVARKRRRAAKEAQAFIRRYERAAANRPAVEVYEQESK